MGSLKSPLDVLRLLDKSNCGKCGRPTCMAFAAAVIGGDMQLSDCPGLNAAELDEYSGAVESRQTQDQRIEEMMQALRGKMAAINIEEAAKRLGAPFSGGALTLHCLGRKFSIDAGGSITTNIHVNPWIVTPVFDYIIHGRGLEPAGKWVPFRDLKGGREWQPMFGQRCEKPCKQLADANPDFFDDLVGLFNAKQVENHYQSDVSMVLHPLPKLPLLICYWKPGGGLPSDLNLFFDTTATENLPIESVYRLGAGLVAMFEKIARNHHNSSH